MLLMKSCVYSITNLHNGKKYVGSSSRLERRWRQHRYQLANNKHHNCHLQRAWNRDGESCFAFEILQQTNREDLESCERFWIAVFDSASRSSGYNLIPDPARPTPTAESRKKMSEAAMGKVITEEQKIKISIAHKGKKHSSETKLKIAKSNSGKKLSDETKKKMSERHTGKFVSAETRQKLSKAKKGQPSPLLGKARSEDTRKRISESTIGRPKSEEHRKNISNARKKCCEDRRSSVADY